MTGLPHADDATRALFHRWLEVFAGYVRDVDFDSARLLWHPDVVTFGTHRDVIEGVDVTIATQWTNVWPRTADFRFDLAAARVLASPDGAMAVVVAPWASTGFHEDGTAFDRPGRATLVFGQTPEGWRVVHSHMSLNRGVPQTSHAARPIKGRGSAG